MENAGRMVVHPPAVQTGLLHSSVFPLDALRVLIIETILGAILIRHNRANEKSPALLFGSTARFCSLTQRQELGELHAIASKLALQGQHPR